MLRRENFTPTTPIQQVMRLSPLLALQSVGNVLPEMVQYTTALIAALPDPVREAIHDPFSGRLVVMIWLLDRDESIRKRQLDIIRKREGKESLAALHGLLPPRRRLPKSQTSHAGDPTRDPDRNVATNNTHSFEKPWWNSSEPTIGSSSVNSS
jgi:hypothetical protein